jgi:23S rRNA pseudouridine2605 synthase
MLLTNDGEFSNRITHPKNNFKRVYIVKIDKNLEVKDKEKLLSGIFLDKKKGVFTELSYVKERSYRIVRVTSVEGRNHFVKRMFSSLGYRVADLERESFAGISTDGLRQGEYKILSYNDIENLMEK